MESLFFGKPIIGIVGGIGSGKSFVADLFGELGCLVIKSDEQVYQVYRLPEVKQTLRDWWGVEVFDTAGEVSRPAVAKRVFNDSQQRQRLERLVHTHRYAVARRADAQARAGCASQGVRLGYAALV